MNDPALAPDFVSDFREMQRRLLNVEVGSASLVVVTVDNGTAAWDSNSPEWVDPNEVPTWTELRLRNSNVGAQILRATPSAAGNVWTPLRDL